MSPNSLILFFSRGEASLSSSWCALNLVTHFTSNKKNEPEVIVSDQVTKGTVVPSCSLGKEAMPCHAMRALKQPPEKAKGRGAEASSLQSCECPAWGMDPQPSQGFICLRPLLTSWLPTDRKLWSQTHPTQHRDYEITNVCSFQPLNSGGICYSAKHY